MYDLHRKNFKVMKIGINGFGRIGRLVFRALWDRADIEITHLNEIAGDSNAAAHLLEFDSVHGRWVKDIKVKEKEIIIDGKKLAYTSFKNYLDVPWEKSLSLIHIPSPRDSNLSRMPSSA